MNASGALDGMLDLLFPKRCVVCRVAGAWLCESCAAGLRPLPQRRCRRCGAPVRSARPQRSRRTDATDPVRLHPSCPECRDRELAFVAASAAYCYEGPARALVTACKFRALRSLVDDMAERARPAFAAAHGGCGARLVTSVPAHRDHRLERGFDPAELLARRLARDAGLAYAPLLRRVRHGARQSGLSRAERAANVRRAFALRESGIRVGTKSKKVIIVDDVYTTGETLNQCAEAFAHSDLEAHVFTFARTVRATPSQASLDHAVQKERCP